MVNRDLTAREKQIKSGNVRENTERECGDRYRFYDPERSNGIKKTTGGNLQASP